MKRTTERGWRTGLEQERRTRPAEPWKRDDGDEDAGPRRPDVNRPDTQRLLQRMRRVDPDQARRYRQRTGQ
jgi:hypothetical protein